jgi:hypothetical protein
MPQRVVLRFFKVDFGHIVTNLFVMDSHVTNKVGHYVAIFGGDFSGLREA